MREDSGKTNEPGWCTPPPKIPNKLDYYIAIRQEDQGDGEGKVLENDAKKAECT